MTNETAGPVKHDEWEEHTSLCLQQANNGLIAEIAFTGLMAFSCFGAMSGLGRIESNSTDLSQKAAVQHYGTLAFGGLMFLTCLIELIIYLRVRVAIGNFCLRLDPTDRPFKTMRLTDSLLGYFVLAILLAVSVHLLVVILLPTLSHDQPLLILGIDVGVFVMAVLLEQLTLLWAGNNAKRRTVNQNS